MPQFSESSKKKLETAHPYLVGLMNKVIQNYDFTVIQGLRTQEEQQELFDEGKTKTLNSKHLMQNDGYSHAVDIAPHPIDWNDTKRFFYLAGLIYGHYYEDTNKDKYSLRWGGDWDSDKDFNDQTFNDYVHFEIKLN